LLCALIIPALLGLVACGPSSPAEEVAKARRQYTVKFNTWILQKNAPVAVDTMDVDPSEGADDGSEGEGGDTPGGNLADLSDEIAELDLAPQPASILFDLLVRFDGPEPLPGITLEVTHADPFEKEKEVRLHFIETASFTGAEKIQQVSFVLDDFAYEDGDLFSVDYREVVPEADRAGYREFP
jgi:hypothetical protein